MKYTNKVLVLTVLAAFAVVTSATADHVNGYYRGNGTYVQPYERSAPDGTVTNNYSYEGNTNPSTGAVGTASRPTIIVLRLKTVLPTLSRNNFSATDIGFCGMVTPSGFEPALPAFIFGFSSNRQGC